MIKANIQLFGGRGSSGGTSTGKNGTTAKSNNPYNDDGSPKDYYGETATPISPEDNMQILHSAINPHYDDFGSKGYNINCQRCAIAFEMQMRGLNVEALPNNDNWGANLAYMTSFKYGFGQSSWDWMEASDVKFDAKGVTADKILDNEIKSWGEGARGFVRIKYRGTKKGHIFNVVVKNGQPLYVDTQDGRTRNSTTLTAHLKQYYNVDHQYTKILRVDDAEFDWERAKHAVKKKG